MTDPFHSDPFRELREPVVPVDPAPGFAAALRARIVRAVLDPDTSSGPSEDTMTSTVTSTVTAPSRPTTRLHALTPYLAVVDARAAVDFYVTAFGARRRGDPIVMPDGRVGHVEVAIGDSVLMLADEFPEIGLVAPVNRGGATGSVRVEVPDPDAVVAAALAAGATLDRPVADSPHGRGGVVTDASGHRWMVSSEVATLGAGDLTYASIRTSDIDRAARFFGAVLGWSVSPDHAGRGRQVTNLSTHIGIVPTDGPATTYLCLAVPDVDAAVAVVRAAGGTAEEPMTTPDGLIADCVDDQGVRFALHQSVGEPAPTVEHGGITYLERRSPDTTRVRAFYSSVLGQRFVPAGDDGYWHPVGDDGGPRPFVGLSSGDAPVVVATFGVSDLDAALAAVGSAGGAVELVETRDDRRLAACTDDQGMPFGLQQL